MAKEEKYPYQIVRDNIQHTKTYINRDEIIEEFRKTINTHSIENDSNTPDFILAEYLWDCLMSANIIIGSRTVWYNPTGVGTREVQSIGEPNAAEQVSIDGRPEEKTGK